jgi:hypothetical protein
MSELSEWLPLPWKDATPPEGDARCRVDERSVFISTHTSRNDTNRNDRRREA